MESSTVVVVALTFVLIAAVVAAMYVFLVAPSFDKDDGSDGGDDEPEIGEVVRGVNRALRSGYEYDMKQDKEIEKSTKVDEDQNKTIAENAKKIRDIESSLHRNATTASRRVEPYTSGDDAFSERFADY